MNPKPKEEDDNFFTNKATATKTARTPAVANQFSSSQKLKEADYNVETSSAEIAMNQEHLDKEQRQQLADVLKEFDSNNVSCVLGLFLVHQWKFS